jgi:hypothetical protein
MQAMGSENRAACTVGGQGVNRVCLWVGMTSEYGGAETGGGIQRGAYRGRRDWQEEAR